jgi:hypothetical protein
MNADNRGFLPAVLTPRTGENTAHLAGQRALDPQSAGLIEKVAHLCAHVSEPGRSSDRGCIRTRQVIDAGDRYVRKRRPGFPRLCPLQSRLGNQLRNLVKLGRTSATCPAASAAASAIR